MAGKILAIDPARNTGWAFMAADGQVESGVHDFGFMPEEFLGAKLNRYFKWLQLIARDFESGDTIACEKAHHRGGASTDQALGMEGVLQLFAYQRDLNCRFVHTATLKKHATGYGKSPKLDVLKAAVRKWPDIDIEDDNHADALWILHYTFHECVNGSK